MPSGPTKIRFFPKPFECNLNYQIGMCDPDCSSEPCLAEPNDNQMWLTRDRAKRRLVHKPKKPSSLLVLHRGRFEIRNRRSPIEPSIYRTIFEGDGPLCRASKRGKTACKSRKLFDKFR